MPARTHQEILIRTKRLPRNLRLRKDDIRCKTEPNDYSNPPGLVLLARCEGHPSVRHFPSISVPGNCIDTTLELGQVSIWTAGEESYGGPIVSTWLEHGVLD